MRKSILWLLAAMIYLPLAAQVPNGAALYIKAEQHVSGQAFDIGINDMGKQIKLLYKVKDSISILAENDPALTAYRKKAMALTHFSPQNDTLIDLLQKIDSVRQQFIYYSIDSIMIHKKDNLSYTKLLATLLHTSTDSLAQKAQNGNRIVLDGTSFTFLLQQNGRTEKVTVRSPTATSHPMLHDILKNTFALYRERCPESRLLQQSRTGGY